MGFFVPEDFVNGLGDALNWFAKFIGATEDSDGKVTAWRNTLAFTAKVIAIVTAAYCYKCCLAKISSNVDHKKHRSNTSI